MLNFTKSLLDRGLDLPEPASAKARIENPADRLQTGIRLLSWFFKDGRLRGVTPEGKVYCHRVAEPLTREFREVLGRLKLRGSG
jgi:hypothetical protein